MFIPKRSTLLTFVRVSEQYIQDKRLFYSKLVGANHYLDKQLRDLRIEI